MAASAAVLVPLLSSSDTDKAHTLFFCQSLVCLALSLYLSVHFFLAVCARTTIYHRPLVSPMVFAAVGQLESIAGNRSSSEHQSAEAEVAAVLNFLFFQFAVATVAFITLSLTSGQHLGQQRMQWFGLGLTQHTRHTAVPRSQVNSRKSSTAFVHVALCLYVCLCAVSRAVCVCVVVCYVV